MFKSHLLNYSLVFWMPLRKNEGKRSFLHIPPKLGQKRVSTFCWPCIICNPLIWHQAVNWRLFLRAKLSVDVLKSVFSGVYSCFRSTFGSGVDNRLELKNFLHFFFFSCDFVVAADYKLKANYLHSFLLSKKQKNERNENPVGIENDILFFLSIFFLYIVK